MDNYEHACYRTLYAGITATALKFAQEHDEEFLKEISESQDSGDELTEEESAEIMRVLGDLTERAVSNMLLFSSLHTHTH
jgi:hypothetical protein